jgi:hypothetical protein
MRHIHLFENHRPYTGAPMDNATSHLVEQLMKGEPVTLYHGTNRDFTHFDLAYGREWRGKVFLGSGVFLTPEYYVAAKYADASANGELPLSIIRDMETIDSDIAAFMHSLYHRGNLTWKDEAFRTLITGWEHEVDANEVADLVNLIPGSKSAAEFNTSSNDGGGAPLDLFATTSTALNYYEIEALSKLGLGDYSPKVYTVRLTPSNDVEVLDNIEAIRSSSHDITVAHGVPDLVDGVPEVIVRDTTLLRITGKESL